MIKTAEGEFYAEGEEIDLPPSFEYLDTVRGEYISGQKNGQWGRALSWFGN